MPRRRFKWTRYAKAVVAFFVPVLLIIRDALTNGVSFREAGLAATAGFITSLVVWAVPNSQT